MSLISDFNEFIEKWCGNSAPHLLDSDDNDGEFFRRKLSDVDSRGYVTLQIECDNCDASFNATGLTNQTALEITKDWNETHSRCL